jgi:carbon storage regulator CsrA
MKQEITRKVRQSFTIGKVKIIVLSIDNNRMSLGVEAPKEIPVNRGEIHARIIETRKRDIGNK